MQSTNIIIRIFSATHFKLHFYDTPSTKPYDISAAYRYNAREAIKFSIKISGLTFPVHSVQISRSLAHTTVSTLWWMGSRRLRLGKDNFWHPKKCTSVSFSTRWGNSFVLLHTFERLPTNWFNRKVRRSSIA